METNLQCVHQVFTQQAEQTPNAIAVVDGEQALTYRELDQMTDALAGYLQAHGVHLDTSVGILMEKCTDYVIACLATLKAGGAYLPLDMAYPEALLRQILNETASPVIVTKNQYSQRLDATLKAQVLHINTDASWTRATYDSTAVSAITVDNLAYIVYSSGTTGEPKGVVAPHRGAMHSYEQRYTISSYKPGFRVACHVFFVWEIFRPLLKGATVYIIPERVIVDPSVLMDYMADNAISEILFTPSLMETILNAVDSHTLRAKLAPLQVLWLNGEVVTTRLKHRALETLPQHVRLFNTYSISECHDVASLDLRQTQDLPSGFCPVGYPIEGVSLRLLDAQMQPLPPGQAGELYIGGPGLARGYLNKPQLTAERFITLAGERLYRTGDVACVHPDGHLEIRGRCDSMVKIRGYSIHLGAIETALLKQDGVKSCAVIAQGLEGENKRLVAYVVRDAQADWTIHPSSGACVELRQRLKPHLADYMIPSVYMEIDAIPINPTSGKINPTLLPSLPPQETGEALGTPQSVPHMTMRTLWERILSLPPGSIDDEANFFDLGGHSLLAVQLTVQIKQIFHTQIMVKDVYACPTVTTLVNCIHHRTTNPQPTGWSNPTGNLIHQDACLSPDIVPRTDRTPISLADAKAIFLTGATGFLGGFLLGDLLRTTGEHVKIYCLTRTPGHRTSHALDRIRRNLKQYDLWKDSQSSRIVPVVGDLSKPCFGLSESDFTQLAKQIDFTFHCAAFVNYVYPYAVLKPHMVDGTQEVLRLASTQNCTPVFYISTNGIFPGGDREPYVENQAIDAFGERLEDGYCLAKWVAEKQVWEAVARGLPVCLFRPGNIGHHRVTGAVNPNDFQFHIMDACRKVQCAPEQDGWAFEMTPVDFLVQAIVQLAAQPIHFGRVYNVVEAEPISARAVFDCMLSLGTISGYVPMHDWLAKLVAKAEADNDHILHVLAQSLSHVEPYLTDTSVYDCSQFDAAIQLYGLHRPATDLSYFELFMRRHLSTSHPPTGP